MIQRKSIKRPARLPPEDSNVDLDELGKILKHLELLPIVLDITVIDYLTEKRFYTESYLIEEFEFELWPPVSAFLQNNILFAITGDDDKQVIVHSCNLPEFNSEMILLTKYNFSGLNTFGAYPKMQVFVNEEKIALRRTDDKKVMVIDMVIGKSPIRVAPKVSGNFVYVFNCEQLVIINLKYMKSKIFKMAS
jgi:hypothetical protein